ncbi:heterokaryon incompatibility protein-domain-containing protein [Apiospora rasikravindrae]|uniref:Heterokaryon incompatibility protein-domain-containing protein n=1 Tax=Apiospora rasikravindrae TaxID=990691 RepID=A0ABR1TXC3_9PEZI
MPIGSLYKPIAADEFRVVHVLPADETDDEVRCLLETRSPRLKTHYEALSYQWGDATVTRPIQIARLPSPTRQRQQETGAATITPFPPLRLQLRCFFSRVTERLVPQPLRQAVARRHDVLLSSLRVLAWAACTAALWHLASLLLTDPSDAPARVRVYWIFVCIINGYGMVEYPGKALRLVAEVWRTKPWLLAYKFRVGDDGDDEPRAGPETPASQKGVRTLWIDALCINQQDEEEKRVQIRRMGWVYANASPVVVWLGDCHGIGYGDNNRDDSTCCKTAALAAGGGGEGGGGEGDQELSCRRELQIRAAFKFIKYQSGSRHLYLMPFVRNRDAWFQEARPGLMEITKRGWWERLWVLQEVALATGHVQIQCGSSTCNFEQFMEAHIRITEGYCKGQNGEDRVLKEAFGLSGRLIRAIKDFRYSYSQDRQGPSGKLFVDSLTSGVLKITRDTSRQSAYFHEQPFEHRLQRILLRTAGRFQCRDDRDRLYAILGIAGGVKVGKTTRLANFMDFISSHATKYAIRESLEAVLKKLAPSSSAGWLTTACTALVLAYSIWCKFYYSDAKHWTLNRPDYVVTEYEDVMGAIADVPKRQGSAELFTALARFLANATKSLAFLDAVSFGDGAGSLDGMPSWVPNWAREVDSAVYEHLIRMRGDDAQDLFHFIDGGKALQLVGHPVGRVEAIKSLNHAMLQSSPLSFAPDIYAALPQAMKDVVISALTCAFTITSEHSTDQHGVKKLVSLLFKTIQDTLKLGASMLLANDATNIVHIHGKNGRRELGFLQAGEAGSGDWVVFVPGCFSHLVLRRIRQAAAEEGEVSWTLVGLVKVGTGKREPCLQSEWDKFVREKSVNRYTIE